MALLLLRRSSAFSVQTSIRFMNRHCLSTAAYRKRSRHPFGGSVHRLSSLVCIDDTEEDTEAIDSPHASRKFEVVAPYEPTGDQPEAIQKLVQQLQDGDRFSVLRGITGTGKTFVMSHVLAKCGRPTLVLCHNKTLAAQLARELRSFLPKNSVELFVSYYNHYIPESFKETTGTYIAKKSSINDEIDSLRHRATRALLERRDVVVVASVSCIYGLGLPTEYLDASMGMAVGDKVQVDELVQKLETSMLYSRPVVEEDMLRGNFQLSSDVATGSLFLSIWPPHEKFPMRITLGASNDSNSAATVLSIHNGVQHGLVETDSVRIFPAKHHVMSEDRLEKACSAIEEELQDRYKELMLIGKLVEAQRLQQRVLNDLLMLRETGFCSGGENYSRHFAGREEGEPPDTLMDYMRHFGDFLLVVDESHVTLPQLKAMYAGDRSRKKRLVKYGYRLPSAMDNRPLKAEEFWDQIPQAVFVSATPSKQELEWCHQQPVNMMIRPTFVCDPVIHVRPSEGQLQNLLEEVKMRAAQKQRTLALALTKRDAEDLAFFFNDNDVSATYIHSGLTTVERSDALKALQNGEVDCLVGVNLLREGLDLPQVSLVAILNADFEGFLRSDTALLQIVGRAARNIDGEAIFYADRITDSMQRCIDDTKHRREAQLAYNHENGRESKSTKGSTMLSIFDLLKDEIQSEKEAEILQPRKTSSLDFEMEMPRISSIGSFILAQNSSDGSASIATDHIPSKPGVYFWKDSNNTILYIGKAKKLRSRVKSYLSPSANHSPRIKAMLAKADFVDFILTPSDRDALMLETNLIKHHQPPYNVLLKDDESYPYICASIGDPYPRFFAVPRRLTGEKASKYRYFGPYPHFSEINRILHGIEETYDLRAKSFAARYGGGDKLQYIELFETAMKQIFEESTTTLPGTSLPSLRAEFEEARLLFESKHNKCRDVVAMALHENNQKIAVAHVLQLRDGMVGGRFTYTCEIPAGVSGEDDLSAVLQTVLERRHYPSGESGGRFPFFPDEILVQYPVDDPASVKKIIRSSTSELEPKRRVTIRTVAKRGARVETDTRAMDFAIANARQAALEQMQGLEVDATKTSVDGTASKELAFLLSLDTVPHRIECYDISHTQGDVAVGSRVVFIDGKPAKHLYRKFNIKTVDGVDDYASLEEVLERRFRRVWDDADRSDGPWSLPDLVVIDGGVGQLAAAVKGMAKAGVYPVNGNESPEAIEDDVILIENGATSNPLNGTSIVHFPFGSSGASVNGAQTEKTAQVAVCALAKNHEKVFLHGSSLPVNDTPDSPALLLLRSIRDESHRFALNAHRRRRTVKYGLR